MIPEQAVEAAAHGLAVQAWGDWEYVPDELRRLFLRDARTALEAAAPHMLAGAKAEAWDECEAASYEIRLDPKRNAWEPVKDNPYREAR